LGSATLQQRSHQNFIVPTELLSFRQKTILPGNRDYEGCKGATGFGSACCSISLDVTSPARDGN
jgi:hypothetical protein